MRVQAFDPGRMCGVAAYYTDCELFETCEVATPTVMPDADVVVIEKYQVDGRTAKLSQQPDALKQTGAIENTCKELGIPVVFQMPAVAKKFATDPKLKALGWFRKTKDGHSNDAARHLLRYLVKENLLGREDFMKLAAMLDA